MNAYIHIPFCTSLCSYCDFTSFTGQESKITSYVDALCAEIQGSSLEGPLRTLYFGGGTPSLLPPPQLGRILQALREKTAFDPDIEISMEANPESAEETRLQGYRDLGVNRLSFGVQAFQKEILRRLGRAHDGEGAERAFQAARRTGFTNVNLDLMFGLSGQTLEMFRDSLQTAAALNPEHLSLYALQVEEGTPLARQTAEGLALPTEDEVADEYALAQTLLAAEGFEQYEVSNFSLPGKACRHNWNIWRGEDYWGFGVGAVGTVRGIRHSHGENLADYIRQFKEGGANTLQWEKLSGPVQDFEKLMLGLRTRQGVLKADIDRYARLQGIDVEPRFELFRKKGFLAQEGPRLRVTPQGYFVLNGLLEVLVA